ncbi:MAG: hypothetical protein JWO56_1393 [Acidobacteria bacterium]|nr:hypothetical protein [Acidobacteriota bacterium]
MRILAAAAMAAIFVAGSANAQLKVPQSATPQPNVQFALPVAQPQPSLESARRIKREDAIKLVKAKKAVFVDVRGKDQYDTEHIQGAISIPLGEIVTRVKEIPPGKMIITYCA